MITPIIVLRSNIGQGLLHPVQRSGNRQLAINNSDHLVLIEPKLPLLHHCIKLQSSRRGIQAHGETESPRAETGEKTAQNGAKTAQNSENTAQNSENAPVAVKTEPTDSVASHQAHENSEFLSSALFSTTSIFQTEHLEHLGFQFFLRLLIDDKENCFNFGRIQEPLIVGHKWLAPEKGSRNCDLGILLNTGEVMVLRRETLDPLSYGVKFRTFTSLLDQLRLSGDRLTADGDIIVSGAHYSELRVTEFAFGDYLGESALFLAHESGDISVHLRTTDLPQLCRFKSGGLVVLMAWCTGLLYYVHSDNSIHRYDFGSSASVRLKEPSRFMVSNIEPVGNVLIASDTARLHVFGPAHVSVKLPYSSVLCGLLTIEGAEKLTILLSFENGRFGVAHYDFSSDELSVNERCPVLDAFSKAAQNRFLGVLAKEQARAPSAEFAPYLDNSARGCITIHGTTLMAGYFVIVYSMVPKNVISHVIKSRREYSVSFVPIDTGSAASNTASDFLDSISQTVPFFLQTHNQVLHIARTISEPGDSFALALNLWKNSAFQDPSLTELPFKKCRSLKESLEINFRDSLSVSLLQQLYVLNLSIEKTLTALQNRKVKSENPATDLALQLNLIRLEQLSIEAKIRLHLAHILLSWAVSQESAFFTSDFDKFILNTYKKLVPRAYSVPFEDQTILTVNSELCSEVFEVSADQMMEEDFADIATSQSGHKWPRCALTLLPILGLSNKSDELETHNYLGEHVGDSYVAATMCSTLNYCVFTGTHSFELKKGV